MTERPVRWYDVGLAALLVVLSLFGTGPAAANQGRTAPVLAYLLAVVASLTIAAWRWRPMWTFVVVGAAALTYLALGYAYGPIMITLALAVYGLAAREPVRRTLPATTTLLAALLLTVSLGVLAGDRGWDELVSVSAWLVVPVAVGVVVRVRRDATAAVRAEQARRATSEERLRLAQEVHDVVGHGLAVIAMQAGVALKVLDREPGPVREALEAIRATSREALDGLRVELDALRDGSGQPAAPRRPTSGLADLPALVERMRASGLPVELHTDLPASAGRWPSGRPVEAHTVQPTEVPSTVDHAAYRIVQESLTNVLRHAGPAAAAEVRVAFDGDVLAIEVRDTGRGTPPGVEPGGHGVDGMRERARALGGTVEAGPRPSGGFAVTARLPCR